MRKLVEAFRNIFSTPDLRNRVLFTLALLGVYRLGAFIPTPGINTDAARAAFRAEQGFGAGHDRPVQRRQSSPADDFRAGHHAVHHGVDHSCSCWWWSGRTSSACKKRASSGRRKITQYTRYLTIILSAFQSFTIALTLQRQSLVRPVARLSSRACASS